MIKSESPILKNQIILPWLSLVGLDSALPFVEYLIGFCGYFDILGLLRIYIL